jgi:hypothetical protein
VDDHGRRADLGGRGAGLLEDLPGAVPYVRLRRADVDQVGGVNVEVEVRGLDLIRLGVRRRRLPGAGIGQEDLQASGVELRRRGDDVAA